MINNQAFIYKEAFLVFSLAAPVNQTDSYNRKRYSPTVEADQAVKLKLLCSA